MSRTRRRAPAVRRGRSLFVYNGGPGSSSIWLRLGSFAPTRVATPDPLFGNWPNYPLVDNKDSLIDTTDLVYIDPPGTGLSEAILPNTNQSFWSTDADVNIMRDFYRALCDGE